MIFVLTHITSPVRLGDRKSVRSVSARATNRALPILAVTIPNADDVSCGLDQTQDSSSVDNAGYISIIWQHDPADLDGGWGLGCRARLAGGGGQVAEGESTGVGQAWHRENELGP